MTKLVDLFGGAISIELPDDYIDASDLRQVPDHQEVWLSQDGGDSIIIEILERIDEPDEQAIRSHVDEIAGVNNVSSYEVLAIYPRKLPSLPYEDKSRIVLKEYRFPAFICESRQKLIASRQLNGKSTDLSLLVCVLRLEAYATDLLISMNHPGVSADAESFHRISDSLRIREFSLFSS